MISELSDEDMLEFLMTSEFEGDISPSEFKGMLLKWRYFYRVLHGRLERTRDDLSHEASHAKLMAEGLVSENYQLKVKNAQKQDQINLMKNRKLTLKERLSGKIITKEDEDK